MSKAYDILFVPNKFCIVALAINIDWIHSVDLCIACCVCRKCISCHISKLRAEICASISNMPLFSLLSLSLQYALLMKNKCTPIGFYVKTVNIVTAKSAGGMKHRPMKKICAYFLSAQHMACVCGLETNAITKSNWGELLVATLRWNCFYLRHYNCEFN